MLWFVTHYVLNLEYCPKTKEVALFMQEFVFKLPATYGLKHQKTATYLAVSMDIQNCFGNLMYTSFYYFVTYYIHFGFVTLVIACIALDN